MPNHISAPVRFGTIRAKTPHACRGQRIGLLGGSFNPPHDAHALITQTALHRLGLDAVWWIVTPGNPLKSLDELAPLADRMALARALVPNPKVKITAFEQNLSSTYTAGTLAFLRRRYPEVHFVWLMGADNLASFHRWQDWRGIAATMPIAIIDRPGWRLKSLAGPTASALWRSRLPEQRAPCLPLRRPPAWVFLTSRLSSLSSTELRARARALSGRP